MIQSIHKYHGQDDSALAKRSFKSTWGKVAMIEEDLLEMGLSLRDLFERKVGKGNKTRFWKD